MHKGSANRAPIWAPIESPSVAPTCAAAVVAAASAALHAMAFWSAESDVSSSRAALDRTRVM